LLLKKARLGDLILRPRTMLRVFASGWFKSVGPTGKLDPGAQLTDA
jgi:hypothetical protein